MQYKGSSGAAFPFGGATTNEKNYYGFSLIFSF